MAETPLPGMPAEPERSYTTAGSPSFVEGAKELVAVDWHTRLLIMHPVLDDELNTLRGVGPTASLAFFGMAFGAFITLLTTVQTQDRERDSQSPTRLGRLDTMMTGYGGDAWRRSRRDDDSA